MNIKRYIVGTKENGVAPSPRPSCSSRLARQGKACARTHTHTHKQARTRTDRQTRLARGRGWAAGTLVGSPTARRSPSLDFPPQVTKFGRYNPRLTHIPGHRYCNTLCIKMGGSYFFLGGRAGGREGGREGGFHRYEERAGGRGRERRFPARVKSLCFVN